MEKEDVIPSEGTTALEEDAERTEIRSRRELEGTLQKRQASLLVVAGTSSVGRIFRVDRASMTVGRSDTCDICLPEGSISRNHLRLVRDEQNNIFAIDLDSTNGTFVNGARCTRHLLRDGETIQLGPDTVLKFSYRDSVEEAFHSAQLEQAVYDGMTGLFNRQYLLSKLRQELAYAIRHQEPASVVLVAIDQFQQMREILGMSSADEVLRQVAELTRPNVREEDLLARYGEDSLAVFLRNQDLAEAGVFAERIRELVQVGDILWDGEPLTITVSAGIATLGQAPLSNPQGLLTVASQHLAAALGAGGNRVAGGS